jgi:uncharacterized protein (TIGR03435 family)
MKLPILLAWTFTLWAQVPPPQTAGPLHFEAASLKLSADQRILESRPKRSVGRLRWNTYLLNMLSYAYNLEWWRISDAPGLTKIYTLDATTPPDTTQDQVRLMLRTLLAERFHLETHLATREVAEGYSLTVAKGGPKLQPTKPPKPEAASAEFDDGYVVGTLPAADTMLLEGHSASMLQLAEFLQRTLGTSVLDRTELSGRYDFELTCPRDPSGPSPDLIASCVKQAGLVMGRFKGPVEFLVIDHLGTLIEN